MFHGFTCFSPIKYAILCVNTFVFPLPAPAITKHGPSVFTTASYCLSFIYLAFFHPFYEFFILLLQFIFSFLLSRLYNFVFIKSIVFQSFFKHFFAVFVTIFIIVLQKFQL